MASPSLYAQFETNLLSNCNVIELLLQLKSAKANGKNYINYIRVRAHLVRHLLHNRLFKVFLFTLNSLKVSFMALFSQVSLLIYDPENFHYGRPWNLSLLVSGRPWNLSLPGLWSTMKPFITWSLVSGVWSTMTNLAFIWLSLWSFAAFGRV